MNKRRRAQAPKKYDRHQSNIGDTRRMRTGAEQRGERFDRNTARSIILSGRYERLEP